MEFIPVSSSNVAAVGYDPESATLGVRFNNGAEYHYFNVGTEVYQGLISASSVGGFLDAFVKKAGYQYARVR